MLLCTSELPLYSHACVKKNSLKKILICQNLFKCTDAKLMWYKNKGKIHRRWEVPPPPPPQHIVARCL